MQRIRLLIVLLALPMLTGCTAADVVFGLFGDYYQTPDGADEYPRPRRRDHFDRQVEHWDHYEPSSE